MGKRECRVCHKIKDLKMFYKNKASRLGRIRMCKKCCSISKRINGQRYRDTEQFGGNRERAIKKDKYKCVYCSMTRYQHKERKTVMGDVRNTRITQCLIFKPFVPHATGKKRAGKYDPGDSEKDILTQGLPKKMLLK
ncbi:MAG: hypothetical protein UX65_C0010G0025 [Parcubacteria group bacterium GW2011_GWB1_46_8]|nr:MAG: hypothetical protein UX65_C0010G0025 [Parcubacteria group bacterium GW2011_GWB1_46_8]